MKTQTSIQGEDGKEYKTHSDYISSRCWSKKRQEFFASSRFWGCCVVCGSKRALEVHHMTYKNIGREKIEDLTCLCSRCHKRFHGIKNWNTPAKKPSSGTEKPTAKEKREEKRKKRKVKKAKRFVVAGSTKIFSPAEIEEYERQLQHMADIKG